MDAYKTSAIQHGISNKGVQLASNYASRPEDERFDTLETKRRLAGAVVVPGGVVIQKVLGFSYTDTP